MSGGALPAGRPLGEMRFGHLRLRLTDHRVPGTTGTDWIAWALVDPCDLQAKHPSGFCDGDFPGQLRALADQLERAKAAA